MRYFPPEQVFIIALEERNDKQTHWPVELANFLANGTGFPASSGHDKISGRFKKPTARKKFSEKIDICEKEDHLELLRNFADTVREELLQLHEGHKGRRGRFPLGATED